ncbi:MULTISPECIES: YlxR family protein [Nocardioides]|uniref:YlxR family protein n=1 Tax=Nocardioides kribbensis TaxID=305517 RepID=A0ABV1P182_9ACTN|nr:YlxR family protein [Nocardioides sp. P86]
MAPVRKGRACRARIVTVARPDSSRTSPDDRPLEGPVRTCVGCRTRAAKRELLRVTAGSDAHGRSVVVPDPDGTAPGRGAHLHPTTGCYDLAVRRKAFGRALRLTDGPGSAPVGEWVAAREHDDRSRSTSRSTSGSNDQDWSSSS